MCHLVPARIGIKRSLHRSGVTGDKLLGDGVEERECEKYRFVNGDTGVCNKKVIK